MVRRRRVRRHRDRRARPGGDHVDRGRQPVHPQHLPGVLPARTRRRARRPQVSKIVSLVVKFGALVFVLASRRPSRSTCSCSAASGSSRRSRRSWSGSTRGGSTGGRCSPGGPPAWRTAPGRRTASPRRPVALRRTAGELPGDRHQGLHRRAGVRAQPLVTVVLTVVLRATKVDPGADQTRWDDYAADLEDEGVAAELDPHAPAHA